MTREEEIQREADNRWLRGSANNQRFVEACKWADQHPRKGLWDSEKVIEWIKKNYEQYIYNYGIDEVIAGLRKAMED